MKKTALIILAEGFEEVEAITPIDLLRRAGIEVTVAGLSSLEVKGSHSILVKADTVFAIPDTLPDAVILPGGPGHKHLANSELVISFVNKMFDAGKLCAAICAASMVFGKAGILDNKKATCFPGFENKLGKGTFVNEAVVVDVNVITARSAGAALPFSLAIIAYLLGQETADKVAKEIIWNQKSILN